VSLWCLLGAYFTFAANENSAINQPKADKKGQSTHQKGVAAGVALNGVCRMPCYQRGVVAVMADVLSVEPSNRVIPASMEAGTHRQQDSTGKHGSWNTSPPGQHRQAWELERIATRTAPASTRTGRKTRTADYISERQQAIKPPPMREVVNVVCK